MSVSRRQLVKESAAAVGLPMVGLSRDNDLSLIQAPEHVPPDELARDERFWARVAAQFQIDRSFVNLENGYYGIMPEPVYQAFRASSERLNRQNSYLLRSTYKAEAEEVRKQLAAVLGASPEEIALTRGGTEALQNLIAGYNKLEPGDEVMYADLDYYSCQYAFNWLAMRRGVSVVKITIPEPATRQAVLETYAQAFADHPRLKLLLLTHVNNRTGLTLPVAEIIAMARRRGIDVILDAAHSWGQLDFEVADLGADFIGFSLHKWIHAPLGLGCVYIRQERIMDIDPCYGDELYAPTDIRARVHSGTKDIAPLLALPAALGHHLALGAAAKEARLRHLRNHWVSRVRAIEKIQILTPDDAAMHAGITSFRIGGRTSKSDNEAIAKYLMDEHRIFTVARGGIQRGDCVRVTPALFNSIEDVERLAVALEDVAHVF